MGDVRLAGREAMTRETSTSQISIPTPERIVLLRTDRLGDVLLNLPTVHALRRAFPGVRVTLVVRPAIRDLLAGHPDVDDIILYDDKGKPDFHWRRTDRLARKLRPHRFDAAIVANPKRELHVAVFLAGIPIRVGYHRKWPCLLTHTIEDRHATLPLHQAELNMTILQAINLKAETPSLRVPVATPELVAARALLSRHGIEETSRVIALHPWSSNPAKQWPIGQFRAVAAGLAAQGYAVLLLGGEEERAQAERFLEPLRVRVCDLTGRLNLRQLAAALVCCRVLVTNDSGPMHLAAAVGTPTVALFGHGTAGGPRRWGPWGRGHRILHRDALGAIEPAEVLAAVDEIVV